MHANLDGEAYGFLAATSLALLGGGIFYDRVRKDERLSTMLYGTAFLIVFSAAFSMLNYLLLTIAGPRIDGMLAAADRAIGMNWPAMMAAMVHHPRVNIMLQLCYISVMPQIAILVIALSGSEYRENVYRLCLSIAAGAMLTVFFWTAFPSFGAFSVYELAPSVARRLALALDGHYAHDLVALLKSGPGLISPRSAKGLVGFPSFHGALAILVAWYAWPLKTLRWPALILNALVLIATPIQGGHHVVDVFAGFVVAAAGIAIANRVARIAPKPAIASLPGLAPPQLT
ncbi:MAG TPA: phosphatase PAP2 family protein [Rhizomicrobium sp.]|nr:phosphatase PAP2 family protein [Rhizomicrobium sp.]